MTDQQQREPSEEPEPAAAPPVPPPEPGEPVTAPPVLPPPPVPPTSSSDDAPPAPSGPGALAAARPEIAVGAVFVGGLVLAQILRRLAR